METIIVKHSDLDKLNYLCEMLNITPRVIHADPDKGGDGVLPWAQG